MNIKKVNININIKIKLKEKKFITIIFYGTRRPNCFFFNLSVTLSSPLWFSGRQRNPLQKVLNLDNTTFINYILYTIILYIFLKTIELAYFYYNNYKTDIFCFIKLNTSLIIKISQIDNNNLRDHPYLHHYFTYIMNIKWFQISTL